MTVERSRRVGDAIREEMSDIVRNLLKDPRIGFVSIVSVDVTRDLRHARVYVSVLGADNEKQDTLLGLQSARGFIRSELGKRIRLRYMPELMFELDDSIEHGSHINKLLDELGAQEKDDDE